VVEIASCRANPVSLNGEMSIGPACVRARQWTWWQPTAFGRLDIIGGTGCVGIKSREIY